MAHRPIAIDGAGGNGSDEGAGGVEPSPSDDYGDDGASTKWSSRRPLLALAPATKMRFTIV